MNPWSRTFALGLGVAIGLSAALLLSRSLAATSPTAILIDSVLFDGNALNDADEAVRLVNTGDASVDLSGWRLGDGTSWVTMPQGTVLAAGQGIWLAGDLAAYRGEFGREADLQLVPWPGFANSGDEVLLRDAGENPVDALVYLGGSAPPGEWFGATAGPYRVAGVFGAEGQILYRRRDPATGLPVPDSDSAADWAQSLDDPINGRKVRYPGWEGDRFFFPPVITTTATITVIVAPDNAYDALAGVVRTASDSIRLVSLTLENAALGEELAAAARRGVVVTVLLEGGPPGGITDQERYVCALIEQAGGACWFMIADDARRIHDRYRYMHAKYMIVDDRLAVVGSENFSPDSLPDDDKADGTWGRRGVFLMTDDPEVAGHLLAVFAADLNTAHRDLTRWSAGDPLYGAPPPNFIPVFTSGGISYTVRFPSPVAVHDVQSIEILQAPENSLHPTSGLLGLLGRAGEGDIVLAQQLSERPYWGTTTSNPATDPNPRLEAFIAAARRGATVRLMLDEFFDVATSPVSNVATCEYVNLIARAESLRLSCDRANPTGLGIHNKMVLARIGGRGYVHIGSINGTELSNKGNREMALQVQSDAAYAWLVTLFEGDTEHSIYLPLAMANYRGSVNRLLISEIAYDPPGMDEAEYVELVNPTPFDINLTGHALADAVLRTDFEDRRSFPPGTIIRANSVLVATLSAVAFRDVYGVEPDVEFVNSDPAVPDMIDDPDWGDPKALFQLGNSGDEVLLWRGDALLDVVAYGDGGHPAVVRCPLLVPPARVLERYPYWDDTDNCPRDFRGWPYPSPGRLP